MYKRKYSLKNRYIFAEIFKRGNTFYTKNLLIKYLLINEIDTLKLKPIDIGKRFSIITSNKFSKIKPVQNRFRRILGHQLSDKIDKFPDGYFIFIPKKNCMGNNGRISVNAKEISSQIDSFLSEMVISRSRSIESQ